MSLSSERVKRWRLKVKQKMINCMGGKCQCCGYNLSNNCLHFHHINPQDKEFNFGEIIANPKKWSTIEKELKKCILVCANCHGEIHNNKRSIPENFTNFKSFESDIEDFDNCPICNKRKQKINKTCSYKCAGKRRSNQNWDQIDLIKLREKKSLTAIGDMFNVSASAIKNNI